MAIKGDKMKITEINGLTGEITQRDATLEEIAFHEKESEISNNRRIAEEEAIKTKEMALNSAKEKLETLGLSVDEIKALID